MKEKTLSKEMITTNITPIFAVHEGDKDDNWLMTLKVGTHFLAKEKFVATAATGPTDKQAELPEFILLHKWTRACRVSAKMGPNVMEYAVDSLIFSRKYSLIEVILEPAGEGIWVK